MKQATDVFSGGKNEEKDEDNEQSGHSIETIIPPSKDTIETDSSNLAFFTRFAQFHNVIRSLEYDGLKVKT